MFSIWQQKKVTRKWWKQWTKNEERFVQISPQQTFIIYIFSYNVSTFVVFGIRSFKLNQKKEPEEFGRWKVKVFSYLYL